MAHTFTFQDVNQAYSELQIAKKSLARWEPTRNGRALVFQEPVIVTHTMPYRRVLFDVKRDANPFFHYMEALWMLAGKNNVSFPAKFASNIRQYSDDGLRLHGAYGYRWIHNFDVNQINSAIHMLRTDPASRRIVIAMWDPNKDLEIDSKDLPCNTHLYFRVVNNRLDMTVCNRSNDLVWGMLGSNIVHFSILQEYIATSCSMQPGNLIQFTNNLHIYEGWEDKYEYKESDWYLERGHYNRHAFSPQNLDMEELDDFIDLENRYYKSPIIAHNACPMMEAWDSYKADDFDLAIHTARRIADKDWSIACVDWLQRRQDARQERLGRSGNTATSQGRLSGQEVSYDPPDYT